MSQWNKIIHLALVCLASSANAQPPRQNPQNVQLQRARTACDAAAARNGYRVMRRDQENTNGNVYQLPMHVAHGASEGDVTCRYDVNRDVADLPRWDDREGRRHGRPRGHALSDAQLQAQQECQNAVNGRPGYRTIQLGIPVAHGARQWDVPLTVQRDGRVNRKVTCRFNTANGKISLR